MSLPRTLDFAGGAGPVAGLTQQEATTVNTDGSGSGKASGADATHDIFAFDSLNIYSPAQYAQATVASGLAAGNNYASVGVRASNTGATKNYYYLYTDGTTGAGHARIGKYVAGTDTELLALVTAPVNGDVIRLEVNPQFLLTAYRKVAGTGPWVLLGSVTDAGASLASGAAGLGFYNNISNDVLVDDWEGGDIGVLVGSGGTRRAFGGRSPARAINSPSGPFDQRGFLRARVWDYSLAVAIVGAVTITPDTGVLQLNGCAPTFPTTVAPATGQLVLGGCAPIFPVLVVPGSGALSLSGFAPALSVPKTVVPGVGSLVLTGAAPTFPQVLLPGSGALVLSGLAPTLAAPVTVVPGFGQLTMSGLSPTFPRTVTPGFGALALSGFSPTFPYTLRPGLGSLVLDGLTGSFGPLGSITLQPGLGALALAGFSPAIGLPRTLSPDVGALVLSGKAPAIGLPITVRPALGQLALSGFGPSISFTPPGIILIPGTGQLTLTGYAPMIGTFTFRISGGPVMTATITAGGVLIASITGGRTFASGLTGGPV